MSLFDVTTSAEPRRSLPRRFIDSLAQTLGQAPNALSNAARDLASGLTMGMVTQKTAASPQTAEAASEIARTVDIGVEEGFAENLERANNYMLVPYRYLVARPLTTALLAGNSNYLRGLGGEASLVRNFKSAWNDSQRISPGQAFVGQLGDQIWGTQGVDKLDWTNDEAVKEYFSKGPQRYASWTTDTALSIGADPLSLAGAGAGKIVRKLITVPVTTKNMAKHVKNIDDAVINGVNNNWSPAVGFFKENADNLDVIMTHSMIANNAPLAGQIQRTAQYGNKTGDYSPLATTLKIAIGDSKTLDNLYYDDTIIAQNVNTATQRLVANRELLKYYQEGGNTGNAALDAGNMFTTSKIPTYKNALVGKLFMRERERLIAKYEAKIQEDLPIIAENAPLLDILDNIISEVPVGSINRQTVSKFRFVEQQRVKNAITVSNSYWGVDEVSPFFKVIHWLNPSAKLAERPSYFAKVGNIVGDRSHLEYAARTREAGKILKWSADRQRNMYNGYTALQNKSKRSTELDNLDETVMSEIIKKHIDPSLQLDERAQKIIDAVGRQIAKDSITHRQASLERIVDNNYMITDDYGSSVFLKALKDYENEVAGQIAAQRSAGSQVTAQDVALAKQTLKNIFKNVPLGESQIANAHFGVDFKAFDDVIAENSVMLNTMVEELVNNPLYAKYTAEEAEYLVQRFSEVKSGELLASDKLTSEFVAQEVRTVRDSVTHHLDSLYNDIWKPTTLMSLKYPSRNTTEGWQRVLGIASEYSRDFGVPLLEVLRPTVEAGIRARRTNNKRVKSDAKKAQALLNKNRTAYALEDERTGVALANALHNSSDSFMTLFEETLESANDLLDNYANFQTGPLGEVNKFASTFTYRLSDVSNLPADISPSLFNAMYTGDNVVALEAITNLDDATVLKTVAEVKSRIKAELDTISNITNTPGFQANMPPLAINSVVDIQNFLGKMDLASQNLAASVLARTAMRNQIEELGKLVDLSGVRNAGQGTFELIPGLDMDDAYAGVIGAIMRKEVSAANSTLGAVFSADRVIVDNILNGKVKSGIVHPRRIVTVNGKTFDEGLNENWIRVSADYANRRFRDPIVRKFIDADTNDPQAVDNIVAWAKSNDIEATRWRDIMKAQIDYLKGQRVPDPIAHLVQSEALFVEGTLPNYTLEGRVIAPLKDADGNHVLTVAGQRIPGTNTIATESGQLIPSLRIKANEGTLTAEDMAMIPENQRVSVNGNILEEKNTLGRWKRFTETIFKHIGTLPEDNFVRHPVYRMMYQAEARRLANLMKSQGRSDDYINARLGEIAEQSHRKAYDTVMTRLYSIERKTNPAEVMRFISPFYMAKQNSNRYWFGYAMRNPQAVGRYFLAWSAPGRVFDTEDENGKDVGFVNPFWAAGVAAKISLPAAIMTAMGLSEKDRVPISLSSFDLINNGFLPFMPEFGSPVYDITAGTVLNVLAGTPLDPELLLANMGQDPELFRKLVAPYVRANPDADERDIIFNFIISPNGWMRSFLAGTSQMPVLGNLADIMDPAASERFNSVMNKNFKRLYEDYANNQVLEGSVETRESQAKVIADLTKQAASTTMKSFLWESFLGFGPFVGNVKIEEYADIKARELRLYQEQYGYEEGLARFTMDNATFDAEGNPLRYGVYTGSIAQGNSRTTNPFGLYGTPQTVRAIQQNRELFDTVTSAAQGGDDMPDNKLIGSLFNSGDRVKDYTVTANNKLYSLGIKRPASNDEASRRGIAVDMGYDEYFAVVNYYDALAESNGIDPNSTAFDERYGEEVDAIVAGIEQRNPIWAAENSIINRAKANNNVNTILAVLGDEKFMNTVGKKSQLVEGLYSYMQIRKDLVRQRLQISDSLDTDIYRTKKFKSIVVDKERMAQGLIEMYPDFEPFYTYYLKKDPLFTDGVLAEVK